MVDSAEPFSTSGSSRPSPAPRPTDLLTIDPSFETTPPPGRPKDEFGIGASLGSEGLSPLQLGQTLVVYHPFAERHPEIVDTAELTRSRASSIPPLSDPSEEPYTPFKTRADFEQAEIFIHHNCTDTMINNQLHLNQTVSGASGQDIYTLKNAHEMHKILAQAGQHQDTSSVSFLDPLKLSHGI